MTTVPSRTDGTRLVFDGGRIHHHLRRCWRLGIRIRLGESASANRMHHNWYVIVLNYSLNCLLIDVCLK